MKLFVTGLLLTGALFISAKPASTPLWKEGDILFQSGTGVQSLAIEKATHSKWSHVGVLLKKDGELNVLEAVQPVKYTPLAQWLKRGRNGKYEVKRLKNANSLSATALAAMRKQGDAWAGKDYDLYFGWSDEELYCSELVWKIFKNNASTEVGALRKFRDYDFSDPLVKAQLERRFGKNLPMEETIVSPEDIYLSKNLQSVSQP